MNVWREAGRQAGNGPKQRAFRAKESATPTSFLPPPLGSAPDFPFPKKPPFHIFPRGLRATSQPRPVVRALRTFCCKGGLEGFILPLGITERRVQGFSSQLMKRQNGMMNMLGWGQSLPALEGFIWGSSEIIDAV